MRRIDLEQVWTDQAILPLLEDVIREWMPRVHETITDTAIEKDKNVTEWAKKKECWATIQTLPLEIPGGLEETLGEGLPLPNVGDFRNGNMIRDLTEEEKQRQEAVMAMTAVDLAHIFQRVSKHLGSHGMRYVEWNAMLGCLGTVQSYAQNDWTKVPTPKQTRQIFKARDFLKEREEQVPEDEE
jgi:hypothetical protein